MHRVSDWVVSEFMCSLKARQAVLELYVHSDLLWNVASDSSFPSWSCEDTKSHPDAFPIHLSNENSEHAEY